MFMILWNEKQPAALEHLKHGLPFQFLHIFCCSGWISKNISFKFGLIGDMFSYQNMWQAVYHLKKYCESEQSNYSWEFTHTESRLVVGVHMEIKLPKNETVYPFISISLYI